MISSCSIICTIWAIFSPKKLTFRNIGCITYIIPIFSYSDSSITFKINISRISVCCTIISITSKSYISKSFSTLKILCSSSNNTTCSLRSCRDFCTCFRRLYSYIRLYKYFWVRHHIWKWCRKLFLYRNWKICRRQNNRIKLKLYLLGR